MRISYRWLNEYIGFNETPEELGELLTSTGLEVENIDCIESLKGGLRGLVVGEVITCIKHPNADRLSLATVDIGESSPCPIVCGASNIGTGQKVIVAPPSTTLYPLTGDSFTIKKTKIRGTYSQGMICSEAEIGLPSTQEGIIVLDPCKVANGTPAATYYNLTNDFIFEIGLTPNRGDATSHIGVARDIKALKRTSIKWPSVAVFKPAHDTHHPITITLENEEACPRYSALCLTEITVKESPPWLQTRLRSIGLSPINNIVDITNYVCHEMGQPLHAFDADLITSHKVMVKNALEGTKFVPLDGKERTLTARDLVITNDDEVMCLAGVMGGKDYAVSDNTKNIFLESAYFSPTSIRHTALYHRLQTDASFRYERGADPDIIVYALKRATLLMQELAGASLSSAITDLYPTVIPTTTIAVKDKNVNSLIGISIPRQEVFDILQKLDIEIVEKNSEAYSVTVPHYRSDLTQEADIIEEIVRIYGLNRIPLSHNVGTDYLAHFPKKNPDQYKRKLGEMLVANGYFEIITNSITKNYYTSLYNEILLGELVPILNASHDEQNTLRQILLFSGLEVCVHNMNRKQKNLKFFEFGKIYWKEKEQYKEKEHIALYLSGNIDADHWQHTSRKVNYFDLTQHIYLILETLGLTKRIKKKKMTSDPLFDYGMKWMLDNRIVGKTGKVRSTLTKEFGLKEELFYGDFDFGLLFTATNSKLVVKKVPKYPEVRRDLSLVIDKKVSFSEVEELIATTEKKLIKEVVVFDVYEGKTLPEGKKAYGLGIIISDVNKTLKDKDIDSTMSKLMTAFEQKMNAIIRYT